MQAACEARTQYSANRLSSFSEFSKLVRDCSGEHWPTFRRPNVKPRDMCYMEGNWGTI